MHLGVAVGPCLVRVVALGIEQVREVAAAGRRVAVVLGKEARGAVPEARAAHDGVIAVRLDHEGVVAGGIVEVGLVGAEAGLVGVDRIEAFDGVGVARRCVGHGGFVVSGREHIVADGIPQLGDLRTPAAGQDAHGLHVRAVHGVAGPDHLDCPLAGLADDCRVRSIAAGDRDRVVAAEAVERERDRVRSGIRVVSRRLSSERDADVVIRRVGGEGENVVAARSRERLVGGRVEDVRRAGQRQDAVRVGLADDGNAARQGDGGSKVVVRRGRVAQLPEYIAGGGVNHICGPGVRRAHSIAGRSYENRASRDGDGGAEYAAMDGHRVVERLEQRAVGCVEDVRGAGVRLAGIVTRCTHDDGASAKSDRCAKEIGLCRRGVVERQDQTAGVRVEKIRGSRAFGARVITRCADDQRRPA